MNKGSKFYNRSMKLWLQDNDIEMYEKAVFDEIYIRTLNNKIYENMTSRSKHVYINKLADKH